jgi:hypothetical protein
MKSLAICIIISSFLSLSCTNSSEQTAAAAEGSNAPKFIPGLVAVDVYGNFEKKGFTLNKDIAADHCTFTCDLTNGENVYTVTALGKAPASIDKIEATASFTRPGAEAQQFIGYAASVPYTGANTAAATQWATDHFDKGGDTTIGSVRFVLTAAVPTARVLALYAH